MYQTCTEFGYYQTSDDDEQPFGHQFSLKSVALAASSSFLFIHCCDSLGWGMDRENVKT